MRSAGRTWDAGDRLIDLIVLAGAGHHLGTRRSEAVEHLVHWLDARLR